MMGSRAGNAIAEQTLEERDQGLAFLCWFILKNLLEELFEAGSRRIQAGARLFVNPVRRCYRPATRDGCPIPAR